jgi:hypothetical protein
MCLGFSSFTSNPFASGAVCNAIKDFVMPSFDLPIMICHQQMQVTGQLYRMLHQAKQLQR